MRTLTQDDKDMIANLRDRGFAVVIYGPDELGVVDPERLEGDLVSIAEDQIYGINEAENNV